MRSPSFGRGQTGSPSSGHRLVARLDPLDTLELRGLGQACMIKVPAKLKAHPEICRRAQELGKPQRRARRHSALLVHELIDPLIGDVYPVSQVSLHQAQRLEKLLQKHLSGMRGLAVRRDSSHKYLVASNSSMVVNDFDFIRLVVDPGE